MRIFVVLVALCLVSCASQEGMIQYSKLPDIYKPGKVTNVKDLARELNNSVEYNAHVVLWIRLNIDPEYGQEEE